MLQEGPVLGFMSEPYDEYPDSPVYKEPELCSWFGEPSGLDDAFGGSDEL